MAALENVDGIGHTSSSTFSRTTTAQIEIRATPDILWALLTNAGDLPRWNSSVKKIDGKIELGQKIRLKTTLDEKRIFTLQVVKAVPPSLMIWKSGQAPFFQGVRTYAIDKKASGTCLFSMTERLSGLMFPMAASQIPDFKESFEHYVRDLKREAELIMNIKN